MTLTDLNKRTLFRRPQKESLQEDDVQNVHSSSNKQEEADGSKGGHKKGKRQPHFKVFRARESTITSLRYNNPHFETLVNAGICLMVTMCLYDLIKNSYEKGRFYLDTDDYFFAFGTIDKAFFSVFVWLCLMLACLLVQPAFMLWKRAYRSAPKLSNLFFSLLFIGYNMCAHIIVISLIVVYDLEPGLSLVISVEQIRLTMKSYSYIRENVCKVVRPWKETDETGPAVWYKGQLKPKVGNFRQYFYFLFVPTLLYRDEYPRTEKFKYKRAAQYFGEFICLLVVAVMVMKNFIRPSFLALPEDPPRYLLMSSLGLMSLGLFLLVLTNGAILHAWMNFGAEMTCFADRHFYEDWWTCIDYQTFYRKWNYVVYDWIHAYIYQDLKMYAKSRIFNKISVIPTIIISSIFHEYVLAVALKYCVPFLSLEFGILGGMFYFLRPVLLGQRIWNTLFLLSLGVGQGLMIWCYAIEYYSRLYCPKEDTMLNAFIPRTYECFFGKT